MSFITGVHFKNFALTTLIGGFSFFATKYSVTSLGEKLIKNRNNSSTLKNILPDEKTYKQYLPVVSNIFSILAALGALYLANQRGVISIHIYFKKFSRGSSNPTQDTKIENIKNIDISPLKPEKVVQPSPSSLTKESQKTANFSFYQGEISDS